MPIALPNLDNLVYDDLVQEAEASIPALAPAWTDHNASEPGVTLIELLAWIAEGVIYRTSLTNEETTRVFLKLLDGAAAPPPVADLDLAVHESIRALRDPYRGVTAGDYESLVARERPDVERVHCVPERDLTASGHETDPAPGHVSVILLPVSAADPWLSPAAMALSDVKTFLNDRRLLTTRLHVVGPTFLELQIGAGLYLEEGAVAADVIAGATASVQQYFDPRRGGAKATGWPFGRSAYVSDVVTLLDAVHGVDFVRGVDVQAIAGGDPDPSRQSRLPDGTLVAVTLHAHELAEVVQQSFTAFERRSGVWVATESS